MCSTLRGEDDLAGSWLVVLAGATVGPCGASAILRDRRVGVTAPGNLAGLRLSCRIKV